MPSENPPARRFGDRGEADLVEHLVHPARGDLFDFASQRRCARADRLGCTHFASSSAPTVRSGWCSSR